MARETNEAGATPRPALALTDGTMRLNGHLATEIGMTPSIILLQIEWMIRHMDNVHFIDGKWWITTSARSMSKKWFKGAITHETICRNLDKLKEMELIIQAGGEKQGDKRIITLNPDGCSKLKSVRFEQKFMPSENLTGDEKAVRKSDSAPSENLTVPVRKSDADLKDIEESLEESKDSPADAGRPAKKPRTAKQLESDRIQAISAVMATYHAKWRFDWRTADDWTPDFHRSVGIWRGEASKGSAGQVAKLFPELTPDLFEAFLRDYEKTCGGCEMLARADAIKQRLDKWLRERPKSDEDIRNSPEWLAHKDDYEAYAEAFPDKSPQQILNEEYVGVYTFLQQEKVKAS